MTYEQYKDKYKKLVKKLVNLRNKEKFSRNPPDLLEGDATNNVASNNNLLEEVISLLLFAKSNNIIENWEFCFDLSLLDEFVSHKTNKFISEAITRARALEHYIILSTTTTDREVSQIIEKLKVSLK